MHDCKQHRGSRRAAATAPLCMVWAGFEHTSSAAAHPRLSMLAIRGIGLARRSSGGLVRAVGQAAPLLLMSRPIKRLKSITTSCSILDARRALIWSDGRSCIGGCPPLPLRRHPPPLPPLNPYSPLPQSPESSDFERIDAELRAFDEVCASITWRAVGSLSGAGAAWAARMSSVRRGMWANTQSTQRPRHTRALSCL